MGELLGRGGGIAYVGLLQNYWGPSSYAYVNYWGGGALRMLASSKITGGPLPTPMLSLSLIVKIISEFTVFIL